MTAKRFKLAYCDYDWWAICDNENNNEFGISGQEVVDLMNELDKENRKLKNELNLSKLNLKEKSEGFDKLHKMYMEEIEENKELKLNNEKLIEMVQGY